MAFDNARCPFRHNYTFLSRLFLRSSRVLAMLYRYSTPLVRGKVTARPSKQIKSPYVADCVVDGQGDTSVLCHCPSLGLGGLISAGESVLLLKSESAKASTAYKVEVALEETCNQNQESTAPTQVLSNPLLCEKLAEKALELNLLPSFSQHSPVVKIERQVVVGGSRIDFLLKHVDGSRTLIEVKNSPLATLRRNQVPESRRLRKKEVRTASWVELNLVSCFFLFSAVV